MLDLTEEKLDKLIDALVDLFGEGEEEAPEFGINGIQTYETEDPLAKGLDPFVLVTHVFKFADKLHMDKEEFGFAIARLQLEFGTITGDVPMDKHIFDLINEGEDIEGPLADTIDGMVSKDYKERFVAEFKQLVYRIDRLAALIEKYERNELDFEPKCPIEMLQRQLAAMRSYRIALEDRAQLEGVDLKEE